MENLSNSQIDEAIQIALKEDIGSGDITTSAIFNDSIFAEGYFLVKQNGIIAGLEIAERVFLKYDDTVKFEWLTQNGSEVKSGDNVAKVQGKASTLLTCERTALNFLQRMSGIATTSAQYANLVSHTKAKIIDTRKTAPGLRAIDKLAVTYSGCSNHRIGLYDMFLIKDNHIAIAGSVSEAISACKKFREENYLYAKIEVEVTSVNQIEEAVNAGADIIMLDNFVVEEMKKAVLLINGRSLIEASGGVNLTTVKSIAETGVDFISVGALTHSIQSLDISLELNLV